MEMELTNISIEKPGEGVYVVRFLSTNRAAAERELKEFIAGRPFTRFIDHFNPNNQIIKILPAPQSA